MNQVNVSLLTLKVFGDKFLPEEKEALLIVWQSIGEERKPALVERVKHQVLTYISCTTHQREQRHW